MEKKSQIIVFEGIDGSGKTSLLSLLQNRLKERGRRPFASSLFKRPALRAAARAMNNAGSMTPDVLCALHYADLDYGATEMKESLGDIFLWDRYIYSSATSVRLRGGSPTAWKTLLDNFPSPDLTVVLETEPALCYERIVSRSGSPTFFECGLDQFYRGARLPQALDKFEKRQLPVDFEREAFLQFMSQWNESLNELTVGAKRYVIKNFDLRDASIEIDKIISIVDEI